MSVNTFTRWLYTIFGMIGIILIISSIFTYFLDILIIGILLTFLFVTYFMNEIIKNALKKRIPEEFRR